MIRAAGFDPLSLDEAGIAPHAAEDSLEIHETFEANAAAKARYFAGRSGLTVLADDSGLEVRALGGAPGVRSRRWTGFTDLDGAALDEANIAALLVRLRGAHDRRARFVCAAALYDGVRLCVEQGHAEGTILEAVDGAGGIRL